MSWLAGDCVKLNDTNVYEYILDSNKLRVLLCPLKGANVCAYMRAVHAGSKEEAGSTPMGAAHFIEHMSFRIQNGKIWSLAAKGDVINAETNMDSTRFYVVHLPEQTEQTIAIDADRFRETAVPANKVEVERHAVLNELERGQQAGNRMFRTTSSVGILSHPYHESTIGTRTDVNQTTAKHMQRFREKYYVPNNTTLIFAGQFSSPQVLGWVKEHYGAIPPGDECHAIHTQEPPQVGKRSVELELDAPCPMICMAFRQPRGASKESLVLQCISHLTWRNQEGRAKTLIEDGTLHDVSTYSPRQMDPYLWFFHGTQETTSPQLRQQTEAKMLGVLQTFGTHAVTQESLDNVKTFMKDNWARSAESVTDVMNELGRGVSMGNWKDFAAREATLDQITTHDVQRVARCTFTTRNMTVTHVIPASCSKPELEVHDMATGDLRRAPAPATLTQAQGTESAWHCKQVTPCQHVLCVPRAAYVRVTLSARFSPEEHGVAGIMTACMGKGTDANGLSNTLQLMSMHSERSFTHDHEFVHMSMAMPVAGRSLTQASALMYNTEWKGATFDSHTVELQKRLHLAELKSLKHDQGYQTKAAFITRLFERTLYHIPLDVRAHRLQAITRQDVADFHRKWVSNNGSTYVTMTVPNEDISSALEKVFPGHDTPAATTLAWEAKPRVAAQVHKTLPGYGSFQIMLGQTVSARPDTDEFVALQCAADILGGGMTGRLMHTVREVRGLGTYGLYASMQVVSAKSPAIFSVHGTFSPSAIDEGMACTRQLLQEWRDHGVTPDELAAAKERMVGSRIIANDTVDSLHAASLKSILDHQSPAAAFDTFKQRVQQLTLKTVNDIVRAQVDTGKMTSVVVGPPAENV